MTEDEEEDDGGGDGKNTFADLYSAPQSYNLARLSTTVKAKEARVGGLQYLWPSEFAAAAFRFSNPDYPSGYEPFSFGPRRHLKRIYDTPARRILLCTSRQVEKSTTLGNRAITYCCLLPGYKILFVSPSATQTKVFSNDRLRDPIEMSELLPGFLDKNHTQNVFEKHFKNRSSITLRYAFLNADRSRGVSVWGLLIDEIQDILHGNINVLEACTSHAPEAYKFFLYSGTPKTTDNTIERLRSEHSTQGEWVVPCHACGSATTGRYWNRLGEKNIGLQGLICERCGKAISARDPEARWANMVAPSANIIYESYRISQLMVPWAKWPEIVFARTNHPKAQFYNEVLGLSFDSGMRPLTMAQVLACCDPEVRIGDEDRWAKYCRENGAWMGVDWGYGINSYTVVFIFTYWKNKLQVVYAKRMDGLLIDPEPQLEFIIKLSEKFGVRLHGCDWGAGFMQNDRLIRHFGANRVFKYYHLFRARKKVFLDSKLGYFKVHRTEVMSDMINAIRRRQVGFPHSDDFRTPFAQDFCNIFAEYNNTLHQLQYDHRPDQPDDSFHAFMYGALISMLEFARPDILAPMKEELNKGPLRSSYGGPVDQAASVSDMFQGSPYQGGVFQG